MKEKNKISNNSIDKIVFVLCFGGAKKLFLNVFFCCKYHVGYIITTLYGVCM